MRRRHTGRGCGEEANEGSCQQLRRNRQAITGTLDHLLRRTDVLVDCTPKRIGAEDQERTAPRSEMSLASPGCGLTRAWSHSMPCRISGARAQVAAGEDALASAGREVYLTFQVHNEAIVVPKNIGCNMPSSARTRMVPSRFARWTRLSVSLRDSALTTKRRPSRRSGRWGSSLPPHAHRRRARAEVGGWAGGSDRCGRGVPRPGAAAVTHHFCRRGIPCKLVPCAR